MSHTITTSDGREFVVDEHGNMQQTGSGFHESARGHMRPDENENTVTFDYADSQNVSYAVDDNVNYSDISPGEIVQLRSNTNGWHEYTNVYCTDHVSDPIQNFDEEVWQYFAEQDSRLRGDVDTTARARFNRTIRNYRRYMRERPRANAVTQYNAVRIRMSEDGTWRYEDVGSPQAGSTSLERMISGRNTAMPIIAQRQLQPRVCHHDSCIHCQGTRLIAGRRPCHHNFTCRCIKCRDSVKSISAEEIF